VLAVAVLGPLLAVGLVYLHHVATRMLGAHATREWFVFTSAYALNYYLGVNNSILLGMDEVARYSNITSLTRTVNFVCTYLLLRAGLAIMGICLSFALAVAIGCLIMLRAARQRVARYDASSDSGPRTEATFRHVGSSRIVGYTLYTLCSFALYRGGLLIATSVLPKEVVAAYGLSLQASALMSTLALVPLQVWLSKLVRAISTGSQRDVIRQLASILAAANGVFTVGSAVLVSCGNILLRLVHSKVLFTGKLSLALVCVGFLVELNILLLANFLVTRRNYQFVTIYVPASLIGVGSVLVAGWVFKANVVTLIAIPLSLQALFCLPLIFRLTCRDLAAKPITFLAECGKCMLARS